MRRQKDLPIDNNLMKLERREGEKCGIHRVGRFKLILQHMYSVHDLKQEFRNYLLNMKRKQHLVAVSVMYLKRKYIVVRKY